MVFDVKGTERVEKSFSCVEVDFLHEYDKPMCNCFDDDREWCVLIEETQGFV